VQGEPNDVGTGEDAVELDFRERLTRFGEWNDASQNEGYEMYGRLNYRTAARTLFNRPYFAHCCSSFRRLFAVFSVLTPGIQKVAPKDRGSVPQRSETAGERVVAADLFLVDRYPICETRIPAPTPGAAMNWGTQTTSSFRIRACRFRPLPLLV